MSWKNCLLAVVVLAGGPFAVHAQTPSAAKRPMTFEDLMAFKRLGGPVPSPDGKWVVFDAVDVNLEANTKRNHLWIVPAGGGESRRLNATSENDESRPRFSPDGQRLIFTAKAGGEPQVWVVGFDPAAGGLKEPARQVTNLSTGADGAIWTPDGKGVVFVSSVYPDAKDDAANKERDEALGKSKVKAQVFTRLFYRHWNAFTDNKRSHLFVIEVEDCKEPGCTDCPMATPRDLTPGDHDAPHFSLGGQDAYAVSPDSKELAYASNVEEAEAASTNNEIFLVPLAGGEPKKISTSPGSDSTPLYSPDGKWLAWRSQARAGFESDKQRLMIHDRQSGQTRDVTEGFDWSVDEMVWSPDSKSIAFVMENNGGAPIAILRVAGAPGEKPTPFVGPHAGDLAFTADGKGLFYSRTAADSPSEIWCADKLPDATGAGHASSVTHVNDALLARLDLAPLETFHFHSEDQSLVQGFLIKPPHFDPRKKYPLKFLIHGGPQGAWGDSWSYRWNPQLFAATGNRGDGYVVVMVNPHGSTGYGQAFTDEVSGDWGGMPYNDLMKGLDYAEGEYHFIDKNREAALGASYGGYMINWILGHNDRFKCLVSHDGLYNAVSAYGETEELWFPEWEYKGNPWDNPELYAKWSPHLFAKNFKTPTLVIHGQLDYRLDVAQGLELFTTLQRRKVPSKMLYFPDEGHWVLKPQNSRLWNKTVNDWVDQWTGAGAK